MMAEQKVCVVVGLGGNGIGDHVAKKFASEGYSVALLARKLDIIQKVAEELPNARAYRCDASVASDVTTTVQSILADLGRIDTLIYNVGSGVFKSFADLTEEDFEMCWKAGPFGLFRFAKAVLPIMESQETKGVIGITGATASWRGMPNTSGFAPTKFGVRALAQSLARGYGPSGIHVFHVVIDGVVDMPKTHSWIPDKPAEEFLSPGDIANAYWYLASQPPSAWTFEMNVAAGSTYGTMLTI